jgi:subtilisin family serine protease
MHGLPGRRSLGTEVPADDVERTFEHWARRRVSMSTYPAELPCARRRQDDAMPGPSAYCYLQGTSMAGRHVAGVAALIISRYGDLNSPQNGKMRLNG